MDIKAKIIEIMAGILEVDPAELEDDTAIGDLPEWDSLHHVQIISAIEKEFGFRFTPDVMMDMEDVEDIVEASIRQMGA